MDLRERVLERYRALADAPGLSRFARKSALQFARWKLRLDPMFDELPAIAEEIGPIRTVLDIGCGCGVAACALAELRREMLITAVDPNPRRVAIAAAALAERGCVVQSSAPRLEGLEFADVFDAIFLLDVIHFLSDADLHETLGRIRSYLKSSGRLIVRSIIPPGEGGSIAWKFARASRIVTGAFVCHRSAEEINHILTSCGFKVVRCNVSGGNAELNWFICGGGQAPVLLERSPQQHAR